MKAFTCVLVASLAFAAGPAWARSSSYHYHPSRASHSSTVHVRGYTRKDGTYVMPHERTTPDSTKLNNWSSKPNVNPYTGKAGTKDPYAPSSHADGSSGGEP